MNPVKDIACDGLSTNGLDNENKTFNEILTN